MCALGVSVILEQKAAGLCDIVFVPCFVLMTGWWSVRMDQSISFLAETGQVCLLVEMCECPV